MVRQAALRPLGVIDTPSRHSWRRNPRSVSFAIFSETVESECPIALAMSLTDASLPLSVSRQITWRYISLDSLNGSGFPQAAPLFRLTAPLLLRVMTDRA